MNCYDFKEAFLQKSNGNSGGRLYFGFHNVNLCDMDLTSSYYISLNELKELSKNLSFFYKSTNNLNRIKIRKTISGGIKLKVSERNNSLESKVTTLSREEFKTLQNYF